MIKNNLFMVDEGKTLRQLTYENIYVKNAVDFEALFMDAHRMTLDDPTPKHFRGRGFMANHMNYNIIGLLKERYSYKLKEDEYKRIYYSINERTRIYFKKLNNKFSPDNIVTEHVKELNSMSMFDSEDKITVLYAGFSIDNTAKWDEITGCYLVEMKNLNKPNWVSDLSELSYKINSKNVQVPMTRIELPEEIVLTHKTIDIDLGKTSFGK